MLATARHNKTQTVRRIMRSSGKLKHVNTAATASVNSKLAAGVVHVVCMQQQMQAQVATATACANTSTTQAIAAQLFTYQPGRAACGGSAHRP
jgi:hypothetical protein